MYAGMWSRPCFLFLVIQLLLFALPHHTGKGAVSHPLNICYLCFCDIVKRENRPKSCQWLSMSCISICNRYHLVGSSHGVDQSLLRSSTAGCAVGGALLRGTVVCWSYIGLITPHQCQRPHCPETCSEKWEWYLRQAIYFKKKKGK